MRVEREGEQHKIRLDQGDNPREVMRAIAVASFELARPVAMSRFNFDGGSTMTTQDADRFIEERDSKLRLRMDYVEGRQVKTFVDLEDDGSLTINTWLFERDRGEIDPVLKRTSEILSGGGAASLPVEVVSTKNMYEGASLEMRLNEYGYKREANESETELKRRIFPHLYRREPILATEILFGQSAEEWDEGKRLIAAALLRSNPTDEVLAKFVSAVTEDKRI